MLVLDEEAVVEELCILEHGCYLLVVAQICYCVHLLRNGRVDSMHAALAILNVLDEGEHRGHVFSGRGQANVYSIGDLLQLALLTLIRIYAHLRSRRSKYPHLCLNT